MKRSALFHLHQRAGAKFVNHCGWLLTGCFTSREQEAAQLRASAGLADLSHYLKFDLRIRPQQHHWSLGGNHYLVMGETPVNSPPGAIDVTGVYANLRLAGTKSREILRKLTSLNVGEAALPNLQCAQASVAHVHTMVLREDLGTMPAFHLLITREYAESVWESIVHAGHEFHLCPCGLEALQMLS